MQKRENSTWSNVLGPSWPELGWVPAPRYLLRRNRILKQLGSLEQGRLLEIGCGAGALLYELAARGFESEGLDASEQAVDIASRIAATSRRRVAIHSAPAPEWNECFSSVVAMEVLEHIEDDIAALKIWRSWLRPGGALLLSVPAHTRRWSAADEWAGHVRRYDENDLRVCLTSAGFRLQSIECYGFPLGNILDVLSRRSYARGVIRHIDGTPDRKANNDRSGIDRGAALRQFGVLSSIGGRAALQVAYVLQAMFSRGQLGTGFIAVARRV